MYELFIPDYNLYDTFLCIVKLLEYLVSYLTFYIQETQGKLKENKEMKENVMKKNNSKQPIKMTVPSNCCIKRRLDNRLRSLQPPHRH
jgi:hypothetical protein